MADRGSGASGEMAELHPGDEQVYEFIAAEIESVPHLEALLLLWNSRPQPWTVENLSQRLYVPAELARKLMEDLARQRLVAQVAGPPAGYRYESERDQLIATVDGTYRREVVRISTMIHRKPSAALSEFAKAFRFTKERK